MFADGSEWEQGAQGSQECEICGKEPATIHVVRIEDGAMTHTHVCQSCAEEMAGQREEPSVVFAVPAALANLFGSFLEHSPELRSSDKQDEEQEALCPVCGTTLHDVNETGLLGCPACYGVFGKQIEAALQSETSLAPHLGKVPARTPEAVLVRREVMRLERMLHELVESERYEEAASVRDKLNELGKQLLTES